MIKKLLLLTLLIPSLLFAQEEDKLPPDPEIYSAYLFSGPLDRTSPYPALETGSVQELLNMVRPTPRTPLGWKARSGTTKHNTTALGAFTIDSLHSYYNKDHGTRVFLAQANDNIYSATTYPPDSGIAFGSSVFTLQSSVSPIFSDTIGDDWVGAGSGETPFAWSGTTAYPDAFLMDRSGETYYQSGWKQVRNNDQTRYMTFIQDAGETCYVGFRRRVDSVYLNFISGATNSLESGVSVYAWRSNAWTEVTGLSDSTASGATPFYVSGSLSWTYSDLDDPLLLPGTTSHLFWYKISVTADITDGVKAYRARVTEDCDSIESLWSGQWDLSIGAKKSTVTGYQDYTADMNDGATYTTVDLSGESIFYVGFANPAFAILLQVIADEANEGTASSVTAYYWSGVNNDWVSVGTVSDGTSENGYALTRSGFIQWDGRSFDEDSRELGGDGISKYWYKLEWTAVFGATMSVWEVAQAQKPDKIRFYDGVGNYNGRALYWPGKYNKSGVDFSNEGKAYIITGPQAGTTGNIFGNGTVNAFAQIHSYGIVSTRNPYRLYLLEGKIPGKFDEALISAHVGVVAPHTLLVVDDSVKIFNTSRFVHAGVFLGPDGFYMTDGQTVININNSIADYFDTNSAPYIEPSTAYLSYAWIDYSERTVHFAVPINTSGTGTQATLNYELVYNYLTAEWYDRHLRENAMSCGLALIGSDNSRLSYTGDYAGGVFRTGYGDDDWNNNINHYLKTSDFSPIPELNYSFEYRKLAVKARAKASGSIDIILYPDGLTAGVAPSGVTTIPLTNSGYKYISQDNSAINLGGTNAESMAIRMESGATDIETMEVYGFSVKGQPVREAWE